MIVRHVINSLLAPPRESPALVDAIESLPGYLARRRDMGR